MIVAAAAAPSVPHAAHAGEAQARRSLRVRLRRLPPSAAGKTAFVTVRELAGGGAVIGSESSVVRLVGPPEDAGVRIDVPIDASGVTEWPAPLAVSARVDEDGDAGTRDAEDLVGRAEVLLAEAPAPAAGGGEDAVVAMRGRGLAGRLLTNRKRN